MLIYTLFLLCVIHDPKRIFDRMHNSTLESIDWLSGFRVNQRLLNGNQHHRELLKLNRKLEIVAEQLFELSTNATH